MKKAIYPGSFDPITNGHLDIIKRSAKICDSLVVAITDNKDKDFMFDVLERKKIIEMSTKNINNIEIKTFDGLLIDFAKKENIDIIIRGLRVLSDFEYEFKMALMNRNLNKDIDTLFMMAHEKYTYISSSLIKEVASLGGEIDNYVPKHVLEIINTKLNESKK